ncbi:MAG: hypothetical protein CME60_04185 [Halobacteriovoraceae bacterium]|nr:hypothetical protein [Halobacteriovoraceae bacterium]
MKLFLCLMITASLVSCSGQHKTLGSESHGSRGPASVETTSSNQKLWGKNLKQGETDFLEELENSPSQNYR